MSFMPHQLDPARAARLPERPSALLETRLPFAKGYEHNYGFLIGLQFALELMEAAPCSFEQAREAVAEAVKLTATRLDQQLADCQPELAAELQIGRLTHELIAQCETRYPGHPNYVPLDDLIRELEEKYQLPPESGAA